MKQFTAKSNYQLHIACLQGNRDIHIIIFKDSHSADPIHLLFPNEFVDFFFSP